MAGLTEDDIDSDAAQAVIKEAVAATMAGVEPAHIEIIAVCANKCDMSTCSDNDWNDAKCQSMGFAKADPDAATTARIILQRFFSRLDGRPAFHSHGLDFHSRVLLCHSMTGWRR